MNYRVRMGSSDVRDVDRQRIQQVMNSGQFSPGPFCKEFEEKFAKFVGRKHALFLNSGTDALRISLLALKDNYGWSDGSSVVVPAITFPATLNVVIQSNLKPFIVDANPHLWLDRLEHSFSTSQQTAVAMIPVHMFGKLAPMKDLMGFAKKRKLKVLEDSCEMVGETAGSWGDAAAFSTFQCHHLQTGVGGLAVTDDNELNELMRSYANHGRDTAYLPGYRTPKITPQLLERRFRFERSGYSARATEFQAALGLGQLERYEIDLLRRRRVANQLLNSLGVYWDSLHLDTDPFHTYMMFPIVIKEKARINKKELVWYLEQAGIETRDMMPITNQPVFKPYLNPAGYSQADYINTHGFYIPCHPQMTEEDVAYIVRVFKKCLTK